MLKSRLADTAGATAVVVAAGIITTTATTIATTAGGVVGTATVVVVAVAATATATVRIARRRRARVVFSGVATVAAGRRYRSVEPARTSRTSGRILAATKTRNRVVNTI